MVSDYLVNILGHCGIDMYSMDRNLESYVKKYEGFLDKKLCEITVNELDKCHFEQHKYHNPLTGHAGPKNGDKELDISYEDIPTKDIIMKKIWDALYKYISEFNHEWFTGWSGYQQVRFNRYQEDKIMSDHADHIHSLFDGTRKGIPILTVLGCLNDDYEGGEFIMWGDKQIEMKAGDVLVFPSVFLYPHRVDPVKSGTRYTFVSWCW